MFLKSIDNFYEIKDTNFNAKHLRNAIIQVVPKNMVQIITDNADVCEAAGMLLQLELPSIYRSLYLMHTLN